MTKRKENEAERKMIDIIEQRKARELDVRLCGEVVRRNMFIAKQLGAQAQRVAEDSLEAAARLVKSIDELHEALESLREIDRRVAP